MTTLPQPRAEAAEQPQQSLSTAAARNLATTTKSAPQMQGITSRWLLKVLPWVQTEGGVYRVNRRLTYSVGDGRIEFDQTGANVRVLPPELGELGIFRGFEDTAALTALADSFTQHDFEAGEVLAREGEDVQHVRLIAHGRVRRTRAGKYDEDTIVETVADGDRFGEQALLGEPATWDATATALTSGTLLQLHRDDFERLLERTPSLRDHVTAFRALSTQEQNKQGEADIALASGHVGEPALPGTFVDYDLKPREYELSVAQTVLRVHTRVADLYNKPMNQTEEQLRLTVEALRERQEYELVNNREFGLLHNADYKQRIRTHSGPPGPDDLDELLSRRRSTRVMLAHPKAIAAIGRELNHRGLYPGNADFNGQSVPAWRGVPILPCNKIPVSKQGTSSVIAMRLGEDDQGVIGLHQTGIPDEIEPGLSARFMGIDEKAVISYLVSTYYSAAVLVPDALGILEDVDVHHRRG
ncbi:family 2B encapsulin nanocompartment shell protein [Streptomyces sp. NPDC006235]|uniref:family 2B encapsulin nanocompartment shell protein n=1 Tax=Streptomyces sp. NPDC006235 TaxID=3156736 RepID=UPI00339FA26A